MKKLFLVVVIIHFIEHIVQLSQLYIFNLPRPLCLGLTGLWFPEFVKSQWLHFLYAVFMEIGLYINVATFGFTSLFLQSLHLVEHTLMVLYGKCIGELWFPRIELHFFYNLVVIVPMVIFSLRRKKGKMIPNYNKN